MYTLRIGASPSFGFKYEVMLGAFCVSRGFRQTEREAHSAGMDDMETCRHFRIGMSAYKEEQPT